MAERERERVIIGKPNQYLCVLCAFTYKDAGEECEQLPFVSTVNFLGWKYAPEFRALASDNAGAHYRGMPLSRLNGSIHGGAANRSSGRCP